MGLRRGAFVAILALAAAVRAPRLPAVFIQHGDEYLAIFSALHPRTFRELAAALIKNPLHLVGDPLLAFLAGRICPSLWSLRLPAFLASLGSVVGLRLLSDEAGGDHATTLTACFLLAISLFHVEWSARVNFYSLLGLCAVVHSWAFLKLVKRPASWPAYAAATTVFLYSHPYAVLSCATHALYAGLEFSGARRREAARACALAWAAAALLFSPWFLAIRAVAFDRGAWAFPARADSLPDFLLRMPLFLAQGTDLAPLLWKWGWPQAGWAAAYGGLYVVSARRTFAGRTGLAVRLSHLFLPVGVTGAAALDFHYGYLYLGRQLVWLIPFYLLAVADGASACARFAARRLPWAGRPAAAGAAALVALACWLPLDLRMLAYQAKVKRDLDAFIAGIDAGLKSGAPLVFSHGFLAMMFLYHFDRDAFRAIPDFFIPNGSQPRFTFPPGLIARPGAGRHPIIVASQQPEAARVAKGAWRLSGPGLLDMTVVAPD